MTGIAIISLLYASSAACCAPGVVEGFTYLVSIRIRHRAHAPQLITIKVINFTVLIHRYPLSVSIVVADVLSNYVRDIREIDAIGLRTGLAGCAACGLNIPLNRGFVVIPNIKSLLGAFR